MLSDPRFDKDRIIRTNGHLLKDSYLWVLGNETFQRWRADEGGRLLWVRGDPGKGKTMLLCGIIEELQKEDPGSRLVYFFCQATDAKLNTATAVLRGLLYLMIKDEPDLIKNLRETYHGRQLFEDSNGWDVLCSMVTFVLTTGSSRGSTVIIDALDECTEDRANLLEFIVRLRSTSSRVIVSSRNWPMIERGLAPAAHKADHLSLELNEHAISAAVVAFIKHTVDQLATTHEYDMGTRDLVYDYLVEKASNTFLWAALACRQLTDINLDNWNVQSKLKEFPAGLDELYARMLDQVTSSKVNVDLFSQILAITLTVFRPVELSELKHLLGPLGDNIKNARLLEKAVMQCGSFLTVRDNVVYFVHQSAKEYLTERASDTIIPRGNAYEHSLLCSNSLEAISTLLRRDIHNLKVSGALASELQGPIAELVPLQYSCRYWIDHFCLTKPKKGRQIAEVERFFRQNFLHWLEAMSLLRSVFESIRCIANLSRKLQGCKEYSHLVPLVQDASRLIRYHRQGIENAPLQVYHSALIFSPTNSIIKELYQREELEWVAAKPLVKEAWGPLLQTFGPHSNGRSHALSLTFSPDGNTIASASNEIIKLWDAMTGQCLRSIRFHGVYSPLVIFSPDKATIASVSEKNSIQLWNVETGQLLRELEGHLGEVDAIDYSEDGLQLVSASRDRSMRLWNAKTGQCVSSFSGHRTGVKCAVFSPNGQIIASASRGIGCMLQVWSVTKGHCLETMQTNSQSEAKSMVFLQDGNTLVVAYEDGGVQVWEISSARCLRVFHQNFYCAVHACPEKRLIASDGRADNLIKLWDIDTGREVGTIDDTPGDVVMLMFSPDGTRLATASHDCNIRLWDLTTLPRTQLADSTIVPGFKSNGLISMILGESSLMRKRKGTVLSSLHAALHQIVLVN
ncbi:vegetative incompatibility protein HET-E-1 [Colletotrichum musicola]|uniref:Vegetative incompatibility protein HET-E-1 n=1 Tax=Colletotrichum musicola TaxID=2175873 RepID=A0A8H6K616_9PEZI|nr:vegetative incompatibility protein HET-E-1 [Colletotrichum musicola]